VKVSEWRKLPYEIDYAAQKERSTSGNDCVPAEFQHLQKMAADSTQSLPAHSGLEQQIRFDWRSTRVLTEK